ncbi:hypothetical protein QAD02_012142 [Eretmocerus hayati]|uniref:Uncharacterized protein n=1 Tax=Eretmocerus hayati TaxID=131215 RepID=A0ACC2NYT6_9HYME|nr:hypothetical protein QAD02_012142 [Eretmocerus hayati]
MEPDIVDMIKRGASKMVIQHVVMMGADINMQNEVGESPIEAAVMKGDSTSIKLLFDLGAWAFIRPRMMTQCLAQAFLRIIPNQRIATSEKLIIFRMLLERGMSLKRLQNYPTLAPSVLETIFCDVMHEVLIAGMIVPGFYEEKGELALQIALRNPDRSVWKYLISSGSVNFTECDWEGKTIFMVEAQSNTRNIEELLAAGANPNEYNGAMSPLSLSMYEQQVTQNFIKLFAVSEPLNICLAFASAVIMGYRAYIKYIVKELALKASGNHILQRSNC